MSNPGASSVFETIKQASNFLTPFILAGFTLINVIYSRDLSQTQGSLMELKTDMAKVLQAAGELKLTNVRIELQLSANTQSITELKTENVELKKRVSDLEKLMLLNNERQRNNRNR